LMMLSAFLFACCSGSAIAFCDDGISIPDVGTSDVAVIWAQAPLFSTNPQINQTGKYLNLYHTALVFQQGSQYWTLEFDSTASDLSKAVIPEVTANGELIWDNDARWCLREGIYNGRNHWTTHFDSVATISPEQTLRIFYEHIPQFNSTVPGAFPQYQFWRVEHVTEGDLLLDDTTCSHVFRVLEYLRDVHQVKLKDMDYKVTRVTLPTLGSDVVDMSDSKQKAEVVDFYTQLSNARGGSTGVDAFMALFQFFLPLRFVYDPMTDTYYKILLGAPGEVVLIFFVNFQSIGELPAPPGTTCDVSSSCVDAMAAYADYGLGLQCKEALGGKSGELVAGGCAADASARAQEVDCFCGSQCYVESSACLQEMSTHCDRGGGAGCKACMIFAFPQISLFGPCDSSWGANALISLSAARACFCDAEQWTPGSSDLVVA